MPNPNLCRDSDLCGDKTQKYTHVFLINIEIVLYFTLAPNLCRDRNLYRMLLYRFEICIYDSVIYPDRLLSLQMRLWRRMKMSELMIFLLN